jgi:hypothetical protein
MLAHERLHVWQMKAYGNPAGWSQRFVDELEEVARGIEDDAWQTFTGKTTW